MKTMQKLEVLIEENTFGSVRPVEVVANVPVSALIPALIEELRLPQTDSFGKQLVYLLRLSSDGQILPENASLQATGVEPGARLTLDSYVIDGSVATMVSNGQQGVDPNFHSSNTMDDAQSMPALSTNNIVPAPSMKKQRRLTRRALLLSGSAMLGIGALGLGYTAYGALLKRGINFTNPTKPVPQVKPTIVAMAKLPTTAKARFSFTQHQQTVRAVTWSLDGTMLASGANDAHLYIWSTNGTVHQNIPHPASVNAIAWSPDGQRIVTGATNQVTFFNALTGALLGRSTHRHVGTVTGVAWTSHNQMQVVSVGLDMRAIVWNPTNYHVQRIYRGHQAPIEAVTWAADGQTIASSSRGGVIRVWNAENGQSIHGFYQDSQMPMHGLAFAPDGMLAVGGNDGVVRLWNGLTCQKQTNAADKVCQDVPQRLSISNTPMRSLAWSPDGRFLATGGDDGMLTLWYPAQSQKPLFALPQNAPVLSLTWSPDGKQLAVAAGNIVTIWELM